MTEYAKKTCHKCQRRQPANEMSERTIETNSKSGWGFSFNPKRANSGRWYSGRTSVHKKRVWLCSSCAGYDTIMSFVMFSVLMFFIINFVWF